MSSALAVLAFFFSLALTLGAAAIFADRLDRLGHRLGMPESLVGLLTAWGADAPELSSAIVALVVGREGVGVGVVLGSNAFNLAAMLGASAVLTGVVHVRRETLVLEGAVAVGSLLVVGGLILELLSVATAVALLALLLLPYVVILAAGAHRIERFPLPARAAGMLERALGETHRQQGRAQRADHGWTALLVAVPALGAIVAGSIGMVQSALFLADRWHLPQVLIGTIILAVLTSLPNAYTGIRLGRAHRGTALVSETLNSNTINLVGGAAVPALFVGLGTVSGGRVFDVLWLLLMTLVALALLARRQGAGRTGGLAVIALYAVFLVVEIARGS